MRTMEKMISAELSFSPIDSKDFMKDIESVLALIQASGVEHTVGIMSTTVIGTKSNIMKLIDSIYEGMDERCGFNFHINISNVCLTCSPSKS